jgi:predicted  nucleic acid-binding Zn-ribbon protein
MVYYTNNFTGYNYMSIEDTKIQSDAPQEITTTNTENIAQVVTEQKPVDIDHHMQELRAELKVIQEQLAEVKKQDQVKQLKEELQKAKDELDKLRETQVQNAGDKQAQLKAISPTSFNTGTNAQHQAKNLDPSPDEILAIISRLDSRK